MSEIGSRDWYINSDYHKWAETMTYDDVINGFVARIEKIARTTFGLQLLRELVNTGKLEYERARGMYLKETRETIKQGLGRKEKIEVKQRGRTKEVEYLIFDFNAMLSKVIESMGIKQPDFVDEQRLLSAFTKIVKTAKTNSLIERIALGEPFLEFSVN